MYMQQDVSAIADRVLSGNRRYLSKAITLIESRYFNDGLLLVEHVLPATGKSLRIGITGAPGVGKSTFIDALGTYLRTLGKKIAILAIDPSSEYSGGSILGDKIRMLHLANDDGVFIRPTPTAGCLGGVARFSRETILLCEAAGYDVIFVETVGVGQSENEIAAITDCVISLFLPNSGDEIQGMKRGSMENADIILISKAEARQKEFATEAARQLEFSLKFIRRKSPGWKPPVIQVSAMEGIGISDVWKICTDFFFGQQSSIFQRRTQQNLQWFSSMVKNMLIEEFMHSEEMKQSFAQAEELISDGSILPSRAAFELTQKFFSYNAERIHSRV